MTEPHEQDIVIRDIADAERGWLLALNNASVPHVNTLTSETLLAILGQAAYARAVHRAGLPVGALIGLWPGTDYDSVNYRWFNKRYSDFLYIDRVMIDQTIRQSGLGRRLYADIETFARDNGAVSIACEVNSEPPNPGSFNFHQAQGFHAVGELSNEDRTKCVVLMMKDLDDLGE